MRWPRPPRKAAPRNDAKLLSASNYDLDIEFTAALERSKLLIEVYGPLLGIGPSPVA